MPKARIDYWSIALYRELHPVIIRDSKVSELIDHGLSRLSAMTSKQPFKKRLAAMALRRF